MEHNFQVTDKVGEVVTRFPKSSEILKEYKIDFCCGGHRSLADAAKEAHADENEVVTKLNSLYKETKSNIEQDRDFTRMSYNRLIDYIVNTHHTYMHQVLPELSELTTKILRVHGPGHDYLKQVHKLFHTLKMDIEQHLIKEEEELFPLIIAYQKNPSDELLAKIIKLSDELDEEHTGAGDILKELRKVTEDYCLPKDACKTFTRTYEILAEMESDLFQHIHLENNILFPRLKNEQGAHTH